jgi:hypothetical protein
MMYHALAVAAGDEDLKTKLTKVDKFVSVAPCLYTGPPIDSKELNSFRKQAATNVKKLGDSEINFLFGGSDMTAYLSDFCNKVESKTNIHPLCDVARSEELSAILGANSVQSAQVDEIIATERNIFADYATVIENYKKKKYPSAEEEALVLSKIDFGPQIYHMKASNDVTCYP